jgi:hypothetical protein
MKTVLGAFVFAAGIVIPTVLSASFGLGTEASVRFGVLCGVLGGTVGTLIFLS